MPTEAAQEVRMSSKRLDGYVVHLPHVADTRDESVNLVERDSSPVITVPDDRREGVAVCGVQTERDLGQGQRGSSG
jgi:hypothetical protein